MRVKHVPNRSGQRCIACGEVWPCGISIARDAVVAFSRGEITLDEAVDRIRTIYRPVRS